MQSKSDSINHQKKIDNSKMMIEQKRVLLQKLDLQNQ